MKSMVLITKNIQTCNFKTKCYYDMLTYFKVYDDESTKNQIDSIQGNVNGRSFISTQGVLYLHFHSDSSVQHDGFTATYYGTK